MSSATIKLLQRIGLFENIEKKIADMQDTIFKHLEMSTKALKTYKPSVQHERMTNITFAAIWAQNGVLERLSEEE